MNADINHSFCRQWHQHRSGKHTGHFKSVSCSERLLLNQQTISLWACDINWQDVEQYNPTGPSHRYDLMSDIISINRKNLLYSNAWHLQRASHRRHTSTHWCESSEQRINTHKSADFYTRNWCINTFTNFAIIKTQGLPTDSQFIWDAQCCLTDSMSVGRLGWTKAALVTPLHPTPSPSLASCQGIIS